ncbi:probable F-box protein At5g04010 [Punica granatum]|uniref:F-box protein n=1 Tax=Punica granatum TaxID=22663 RepID=A0A218X2N1_PUNGR|nr:probable F-box protein At5g04010 [Punica granatum]OWM78920.1 hypothetical protein CDL15_Pgr003091 [Punica granatum]
MSPTGQHIPTNPPPWDVLVLVAHRLDPKTLAVASCVCKSWAASMSSDCLWEPICSMHYPSLSSLHWADPSVPFRRLFSMGFTASKCRNRCPPPPHLSLDSLDFIIDIRALRLPIATVAKPGEELKLELGPNNLFQFDIENTSPDHLSVWEVPCLVRVTWNVVIKGWGGVFTVMDCNANVSLIPGAEWWFSEELPPPAGWCVSGGVSGVVADMKVVFCGQRESEGKLRVEKASVGMLSALSWRYLSVDDGLRYLQNFLGSIE